MLYTYLWIWKMYEGVSLWEDVSIESPETEDWRAFGFAY